MHLRYPELEPEDHPNGQKWQLPTLYKIGKTGKTLFWEIGFDGTELVSSSGTMDTEKPKISTVEVTRKREKDKILNAWEEAKSKYRKKIRNDGYNKGRENAQICKKLMLATEYTEKIWNYEGGIGVSPKSDGVRVRIRVTKDGLIAESRSNKAITSLNHFFPDAQKLLSYLPDGSELDGEAYDHSIPFQYLSGLIRRIESTQETLRLKYMIFDFIPPEPIVYKKRIKILKKSYDKLYTSNLESLDEGLEFKPLQLVTYIPVENLEDLKIYHQIFMDWGFEGTIIRKLSEPYGYGRSNCLLKYKDFYEEEFPIVRIEKGKGTQKDAAIFYCQCNGTIFRATMATDIQTKRKYYNEKNKIVGKMLTVKFKQYTDGGVPREPVAKGIRDYE